jgi:hypothetical protein
VGRASQTLVRQYSVTGSVAGSPRDVQRITYDNQGNVRQAKPLNIAGSGYNISLFEYTENLNKEARRCFVIGGLL